MANLETVLLILLVINGAFILIDGVNQDDSNLLLKLVTNPSSLTVNDVLLWLAFTGAIGLAGTVIGTFLFKNDVFIFGSSFFALIALAHPIMVSMWNVFNDSWGMQIAGTIVGPIYLIYIVAMIGWLRTGR
jgi:hypothetical protein